MKKYIITSIALVIGSVSNIMAQLPDPGFVIDERTAIVITDPQNDFLSTTGVAWGLVGPSVEKNNTIANIETLFQLGEKYNTPVFVSPHLLYDHDLKWQFKGAMHEFAHSVNLLKKDKPINGGVGLGDAGADIYGQYKKYVETDNVLITSPHKIFGPETNDLIMQLRKQKIDKVILAGMLSNLCTEAHLRELVEQGFEVAVIKDATAAAILPDMNGYEVAVVNYSLISSHVFSTDEIKVEFSNFKREGK